jgi:hypothetical protein
MFTSEQRLGASEGASGPYIWEKNIADRGQHMLRSEAQLA